MPTLEDQLAACPLFAQISASELQALFSCLQPRTRTAARHEIIFFQSDPARDMGVVLSGAVEVVQEDIYGRRTIIARLGPGQLFGESFAGASIAHLPVSVIAAEASRLALFDCTKILSPCSGCTGHRQLIQNLLRIVCEKNLQLNRKLYCLSRPTTREKLMAYLLEQARLNHSHSFTIPFDRQALADYLGVERSAMSAELSKLRRDGILETHRSHFRLLQPGGSPIDSTEQMR